VRGELLGGGVEAFDDVGGPLGEQPARLGEPDAAPGALDELGAGLGPSLARWWLTEGWE
jgi:hypothetical protein